MRSGRPRKASTPSSSSETLTSSCGASPSRTSPRHAGGESSQSRRPAASRSTPCSGAGTSHARTPSATGGERRLTTRSPVSSPTRSSPSGLLGVTLVDPATGRPATAAAAGPLFDRGVRSSLHKLMQITPRVYVIGGTPLLPKVASDCLASRRSTLAHLRQGAWHSDPRAQRAVERCGRGGRRALHRRLAVAMPLLGLPRRGGQHHRVPRRGPHQHHLCCHSRRRTGEETVPVGAQQAVAPADPCRRTGAAAGCPADRLTLTGSGAASHLRPSSSRTARDKRIRADRIAGAAGSTAHHGGGEPACSGRDGQPLQPGVPGRLLAPHVVSGIGGEEVGPDARLSPCRRRSRRRRR